MDKEYDIVYCKECNAIKITQDDKTCLGCGKQSSVIGFKHDVIQDILHMEEENEG